MAEIDNQVALQVKPQNVDLSKALSAISQQTLANAHAGLYSLQAAQEARKLSAIDIYSRTGSLDEFVKAGGDPSVATQIQGLKRNQQMYGDLAKHGDAASRGDPQALGQLGQYPKEFGEITTGVKNRAEAGKILTEIPKVQAETEKIGLEQGEVKARTKKIETEIPKIGAETEKVGAETGEIGARTQKTKIESRADIYSRVGNVLDKDQSEAARVWAAGELKAAGMEIPPLLMGSALKATPDQIKSFAGNLRAYGQTATQRADTTGEAAANKAAGELPYKTTTVGPGQTTVPTIGAWGPGGPPQPPASAPSGQFTDQIIRDQNGQLPQFPPRPPVAQAPGIRGMSIQQKEEQEKTGAFLGEMPKELHAQAQAAKDQNAMIDQMDQDSKTWRMGEWASSEMKVRSYMKSAANMWGIEETRWDKPVADYQSFVKTSSEFLRKAVRETSSRAAVQEFGLIQRALPGADMSRGGFEQITAQMRGLNDARIVKEQAASQWKKKNGTLDGFAENWDKAMSPNAFIYARLTPQDRTAVVNNLRRTEEGRAVLTKMRDQSRLVHENGWDEAL